MFKQYSQAACQFECVMRQSVDICKCIPVDVLRTPEVRVDFPVPKRCFSGGLSTKQYISPSKPEISVSCNIWFIP